jgi:hypothetical protein
MFLNIPFIYGRDGGFSLRWHSPAYVLQQQATELENTHPVIFGSIIIYFYHNFLSQEDEHETNRTGRSGLLGVDVLIKYIMNAFLATSHRLCFFLFRHVCPSIISHVDFAPSFSNSSQLRFRSFSWC